jgi:hypothetical protein
LAKIDPTKTVILTSTLGLQDQYGSELGFLDDVRGMRNYRCLAAADEFRTRFHARLQRGETVTCDDGPCKSDVPCTLKMAGCLYFDAYRTFMRGQAGVTSYDKWLSSRRYSNGLGAVPRLICDEGHAVAEHLMSACRIELPAREYDGKGTPPATTEGWRLWAANRQAWLERIGELKVLRKHNVNAVQRLESMAGMDEHWAWERTDRGWTFEPVVPRLLLPLLCDTVQERVVLMSATITPALLTTLGISANDITFLDYGSTFPVERRPVHVVECVRVDQRWTEDDKQRWLDRIDTIITRRRDRKGIIHTVSYARAQWINERSKHRDLMLVRQPGEPTAAFVARFQQQTTPCILLHPAVETGFSFPDDQARYQIIAKVPFVSTASPIARARIKENPEYRNQAAMQRIVQATGRIVRSDQDWGETFVIDDHFKQWFWRAAAQYAPSWFRDAVRFDRIVPKPLTS